MIKTSPESTTHGPTEQITSSKSTTEDLRSSKEQTTQHLITTAKETTITSAESTTEPIPDIATTTLADVMTRTFCPNTTGNLSKKLITNDT